MSAEASSGGPEGPGMQIRPTPTDEEAAAITAAVYAAWPRPAAPSEMSEIPTSWRFSGRWWRNPTWRRPAKRRRP